MLDKRTKKMQKALPLEGIIAFVDTQNDDGTDASTADSSLIKNLGALIADSFSDEITHFVCSTASAKRLKAAAIFEIVVVSRAWIESCVISGLRTSEKGFALDNEKGSLAPADLTNLASSTSFSDAKEVMAPKTCYDVESQLAMTKSQVAQASGPKTNKRKDIVNTTEINVRDSAAPSKESDVGSRAAKHVRNSIDSEKTDSGILPNSHSSKTVIENESSIPLPKFKELTAIKVLPAVLKLQRRSERICDNAESQEGSPPDVDVNVSMPIVRLDCHEVSCTEIATAPIVAVRQSSSDTTTKAPKVSSYTVKRTREQIAEVAIISLKEDKKSEITVPKKNERNSIADAKPSNSLEDGSRMVDILGAKIVIAISGFDEIGEKATMTSSLEHFIGTMSRNSLDGLGKDKKKVSNSGSSSSSSKKASGPTVVLLDQEEDSFGLHCTHVILQSTSSKRSLRVLLALARGTPIVTEEWFYSSLSTQDWVDPVPFLHAHHSGQQLARGLNKAQRIFLNTRFFVGHSSNPSQIFLETALSASGGSIADDLGSSDYLIFGNTQDSQDWLEKNASKDFKSLKAGSTEITKEDIQAAYSMVTKKRVVTCKYICDCLEAGKMIEASPLANHLIEFSNSSNVAKRLSLGDQGSKKRKSSVDGKESRLSWDSMEVENEEEKVERVQKVEKVEKKVAKPTVADKKKDIEVTEPKIRKNIVILASSEVDRSVGAIQSASCSKSDSVEEKKITSKVIKSASVARDSSRRLSGRTVLAKDDAEEEEGEKIPALSHKDGKDKDLQADLKFSVPRSPPSDPSRRRLSSSRVIVDSPPLTPSPVSLPLQASKVSKGVASVMEVPSGKREPSLQKAKKDFIKVTKPAKHLESSEATSDELPVDENNNFAQNTKTVDNADSPDSPVAIHKGQAGIVNAHSSPRGRPDSPCW